MIGRKAKVLDLLVVELRSGGKAAMTEDMAAESGDVKQVRQRLSVAVYRDGDTTSRAYSEPTEHDSVIAMIDDYVLSQGVESYIYSTEEGFRYVKFYKGIEGMASSMIEQKNAIVQMVERGPRLTQIAEVLEGPKSPWFTNVMYNDGTYSGITTWSTLEQAVKAALKWL